MNNNFDLQESLAQAIMDHTGLKLRVAYLALTDCIGIVPSQGSHRISVDFSGEEYWVYNYAITMRDNDAQKIKNSLFKISNYLNNLSLDDIKSSNNSFRLDKVSVSSAPSELEENTSGTVTYMLDVAVFVYTN